MLGKGGMGIRDTLNVPETRNGVDLDAVGPVILHPPRAVWVFQNSTHNSACAGVRHAHHKPPHRLPSSLPIPSHIFQTPACPDPDPALPPWVARPTT